MGEWGVGYWKMMGTLGNNGVVGNGMGTGEQNGVVGNAMGHWGK